MIKTAGYWFAFIPILPVYYDADGEPHFFWMLVGVRL